MRCFSTLETIAVLSDLPLLKKRLFSPSNRIAFLKKEVRLTDKKGTLYTQELEYNLATSIGKYKNGGKVVNGKTILTSTEGIYYADTKDIFFKNKVHLIDPKYDIITDTLLYNTQTQISSWNTPTKIKSENGGDIYSSNGTYDLKNGKAYFDPTRVEKYDFMYQSIWLLFDSNKVQETQNKEKFKINKIIRISKITVIH
jgi:hypothetical protein